MMICVGIVELSLFFSLFADVFLILCFIVSSYYFQLKYMHTF